MTLDLGTYLSAPAIQAEKNDIQLLVSIELIVPPTRELKLELTC